MIKLTGKQQSSFISGRSISNNIIIEQEVIHSPTKRKRRSEGFIIKVDLKKAYDHVDWNFLPQVLKFKGFNSLLRRLIMQSIFTTSLPRLERRATTEVYTNERAPPRRPVKLVSFCDAYGSVRALDTCGFVVYCWTSDGDETRTSDLPFTFYSLEKHLSPKLGLLNTHQLSFVVYQDNK